MEILEAVIEEEIESVISEIVFLSEDDYGGDYGDNYPSAPTSGFGGGYGGGGGGGGDSTGSSPLKRGGFIGSVMGLDALRGAWAKAKSTAAKLVVQGASLLGTLIGGSIAAVIPFNNPEAVNYIADKMKSWEGKHLKDIEEYYKKDMAEVEAGWELFKKDFWGVGFFVAPFNMVTAAAVTAKGAEAAASILNVLSAGKLNAGLNGISEFFRLNDIHDPGSYQSYLANKEYEKDRAKREKSRNPFVASSDTAQEPELEKVARRLENLSASEQERYFSNLSPKRKEQIKKLMGLNEGTEFIDDKIIIEGILQKIFGTKPGAKIPNELLASIQNWKINKPDPSPAGPKIKEIEKIVGKEQTHELLKNLISQTQVPADEQRFINKNLPMFFKTMYGPEFVQEINNLATKYPVDPAKLASMKTPETVSRLVDDSIAALVKKNKNVDPSRAKGAIENSKAVVLRSLQAVNPPVKAPPAAPPAAPPVATQVPTAAPVASASRTAATPNVARR